MTGRRGQLGELEHLALLAVVRLGDDAYGASVRRELEAVAEHSVSIATVYVTLVRLEKKGLLESWESDPEPVRGGKAKRCYRLTAVGERAVVQAREVLDRMWVGVDHALGVDR